MKLLLSNNKYWVVKLTGSKTYSLEGIKNLFIGLDENILGDYESTTKEIERIADQKAFRIDGENIDALIEEIRLNFECFTESDFVSEEGDDYNKQSYRTGKALSRILDEAALNSDNASIIEENKKFKDLFEKRKKDLNWNFSESGWDMPVTKNYDLDAEEVEENLSAAQLLERSHKEASDLVKKYSQTKKGIPEDDHEDGAEDSNYDPTEEPILSVEPVFNSGYDLDNKGDAITSDSIGTNVDDPDKKTSEEKDIIFPDVSVPDLSGLEDTKKDTAESSLESKVEIITPKKETETKEKISFPYISREELEQDMEEFNDPGKFKRTIGAYLTLAAFLAYLTGFGSAAYQSIISPFSSDKKTDYSAPVKEEFNKKTEDNNKSLEKTLTPVKEDNSKNIFVENNGNTPEETLIPKKEKIELPENDYPIRKTFEEPLVEITDKEIKIRSVIPETKHYKTVMKEVDGIKIEEAEKIELPSVKEIIDEASENATREYFQSQEIVPEAKNIKKTQKDYTTKENNIQTQTKEPVIKEAISETQAKETKQHYQTTEQIIEQVLKKPKVKVSRQEIDAVKDTLKNFEKTRIESQKYVPKLEQLEDGKWIKFKTPEGEIEGRLVTEDTFYDATNNEYVTLPGDGSSPKEIEGFWNSERPELYFLNMYKLSPKLNEGEFVKKDGELEILCKKTKDPEVHVQIAPDKDEETIYCELDGGENKWYERNDWWFDFQTNDQETHTEKMPKAYKNKNMNLPRENLSSKDSNLKVVDQSNWSQEDHKDLDFIVSVYPEKLIDAYIRIDNIQDGEATEKDLEAYQRLNPDIMKEALDANFENDSTAANYIPVLSGLGRAVKGVVYDSWTKPWAVARSNIAQGVNDVKAIRYGDHPLHVVPLPTGATSSVLAVSYIASVIENGGIRTGDNMSYQMISKKLPLEDPEKMKNYQADPNYILLKKEFKDKALGKNQSK